MKKLIFIKENVVTYKILYIFIKKKLFLKIQPIAKLKWNYLTCDLTFWTGCQSEYRMFVFNNSGLYEVAKVLSLSTDHWSES